MPKNNFVIYFNNRHINPTDNLFVNYATVGGRIAQLLSCFPMGTKLPNFQFPTNLVKFFAKINWTYNLKEPSEKLMVMMVKSYDDEKG